MKSGVIECVFVAVLLVVVFLAVWFVNDKRCENRWEGSGMKSEFRLMQGCIITLPDGRKIPADNYRQL